MQVKGVSVAATREFVKSRFEDAGYEKWLAAMPAASKKIFDSPILASEWYEPAAAFQEPTKAVCAAFYGGDLSGARELGKFAAVYSMKGIYKIFMKVASVTFVLERAGQIFTSYYKPSAISVTTHGDKAVTLSVTQFEGMTAYVEARIGGWLEGVLEMCARKEIKVITKKSMSKGDKATDFYMEWK